MAWTDGLAAGALGALGNIIGTITGTSAQQKAQDSANQTNLQINRENNEANAQLAAQQNQWNIDQWNRENEYNSPAHQLELVKEAGLNPNFYMGSVTGNSGASQLTSAPLANQVAGHVDAPQGIGQIIQQGASAAANSLLQGKQLAIAEKKTDAEIENLAAQSENTKANTEYLREVLKPQTEAQTENIKQLTKNLEATNTQITAQTTLLREQYLNLSKQNKWFDVSKMLELSQVKKTIDKMSSEMALQLTQMGLNKATALEVSRRSYQTYVSGAAQGKAPTLFDYTMNLMLGNYHQAEANSFNLNMLGERSRIDVQNWQKKWEIDLRQGNAQVYETWSRTVSNYARSLESLVGTIDTALQYTPAGTVKGFNKMLGNFGSGSGKGFGLGTGSTFSPDYWTNH